MSSEVEQEYGEDYDGEERCCKHVRTKCIEDWSSFPSADLCPLKEIIQTNAAARFDLFLLHSEVVETVDDGLKLHYDRFKFCPYSILGKIIHHRAIGCARKMFGNVLAKRMNLNIKNCYGSYALHDAAVSLDPDLVDLLLCHGARYDIQSRDLETSQVIYPLNYAIESLSIDQNLIHWNSKKSIFKLIITLCLPQMKGALQTIAVLSKDSRTLSDVLFSAVKRGQVTQVAALLLVARDRIMKEVKFSGNEITCYSLLFPKCILNELATLIDQEYALRGRKECTGLLHLCLKKKELMAYILQLIKIFDKVGPDIESYRLSTTDMSIDQVVTAVADILQKGGFTLGSDDTDFPDADNNLGNSGERLSSKLDYALSNKKLEQRVDDAGNEPTSIWYKPPPIQHCRCDVRRQSCTTNTVFHRIVELGYSHKHQRYFSSGRCNHARFLTDLRPRSFENLESRHKVEVAVKQQSRSQFQPKRVVSFLLSTLRRRG